MMPTPPTSNRRLVATTVRIASAERAVQREPHVGLERVDVDAVLAVEPVAEERDRREEDDAQEARAPRPARCRLRAAPRAPARSAHHHAELPGELHAEKARRSPAATRSPRCPPAPARAPQRHPVDHEDDRRVAGQEAQHPRDRRVAADEGQEGRNHQVAGRRRAAPPRRSGSSPAPAGPTAPRPGTDSRNEKRAARGPVEAEEQPGGDRRARARHARDQRQRLREADRRARRGPGSARSSASRVPTFSAASSTRPSTISATPIRYRSRAPVSIWSLNAPRRSRSGSCRARCTSRAARRASARGRAAVAQRPQPRARDPHQVVAEVEQHGGHRPELGDRRERGARVLPAEEGRARCADDRCSRSAGTR